MKAVKYILTAGFAACIFACGYVRTEAADLPEVLWGHSSVNAMKNRPETLADREVLVQISREVNDRLHLLAAQGKLPFALKENDDTFFEEDLSDNGMVTLIPLVMDDNCFLSEYTVNGVTFYKAIVMTQIDIAFCYYSGSGDSLRILHVVPLLGYSVMGSQGEYTAPIGKAELRQQFMDNAALLIRQDLIFTNKRFLKDLDVKMLTPDTWQVTGVNVSSEAARKFYRERLPLAKALVASAFTSRYAALHDDKTVLPSLESGDWQEDAAKQTYMLSLGDTGKYIVMNRAGNEIVLDLSKVAAFDVPLKHDTGIYKKKGYTAEICNLKEGNKGSAVVQRTVPADTNPNQVRHDLEGVLAELLTDAARNAAEVGKKK